MKSIRTKIMWLLFSSVLIASVIIGMLGILLTSDVIQVSSTENMTLLCRNHADKVDMTLSKVEESVNTLAHFADTTLTDVSQIRDAAFRRQYADEIRTNALNHIESVDGAMAIYLRFDPTYVGEIDGFFYAKPHDDGEFIYHPLSDTATDDVDRWYIPTVSGSATWFESYYDANLKQYVISYVVPLYKGEQLVGVLGADISADYIENMVKEMSIFTSGQAAILKSDGTVMYHPNFDRGVLIGEGDPGFDGVIEHLTHEHSTTELISYRLKGEKKKLASCQLRNGMLMVCFAPESEIYLQQNRLTMFNVAITAAVVLVALLAAVLVSRQLVRPIKNLNEAAKRLTYGEFDYDIQSDTYDEIGELTSTFIETRNVLKHQIHLLDAEAHRDGLTGVCNKSAYMDREAELNAAIADGTADFSLVVFDLNKLKVANDVFGHMAGDHLLLTFASYLATVFDVTNVYRTGGDEFVVIIPEDGDGNSEEIIAACVEGMQTLSVEGYPDCRVSCAYGASRLNKELDHQLSDVLRRADKEMYKNKSETKRETYPWQKDTKGIKQLQIDKYSELLQSLTKSVDDYLFLMNLETGYLRFFGGAADTFAITEGNALSDEIRELLNYIHVNDRAALTAAIQAVLDRDTETIDIHFRMRGSQDPTFRWANCRGNVIKDETDSHFVVIGRISPTAVKHLYNPITTLFNRQKLMNDLHSAAGKSFNALLLLDVDHLSDINFRHGSDFGDQLLKALAEELESRFSLQQIYHAEKDRFVVLLDTASSRDVERLFEDIRGALTDRCSISAAVVPNDLGMYVNADTIYDYAVQVLNHGKREGDGNLAFFSKETLIETLSAAELYTELDQSVKNGFRGFSLVYQPQIDATDYSIRSAEALLRYHSDVNGPVYPDRFIPLLEKTGLIQDVGMWVVEEALRQCKVWRAHQPHFQMSVNIAPQQLEKKRTVTHILDLLAQQGLPGEALILEITETSQLGDSENVIGALTKLRDAGVQIAIDDFGTGYANLGHLKHIRADILKVDRLFIRDIKDSGYIYSLLYNVLGFAKGNDLKVCFEGVETKEELQVLAGLQPDCFQGYLFDRPCPAATIEAKYFHTDTEEYDRRATLTEQLLKDKQYAPLSIETKPILRGIHIGLWIIRFNRRTREGEMYGDEIMQQLMGIDDTMTPQEAYRYWRQRIPEEDRTTVDAMSSEMTRSDRVVQVEYTFDHPQKGLVRTRSSGRCTEKTDDTLVFEGFHRILSDISKSFTSAETEHNER